MLEKKLPTGIELCQLGFVRVTDLHYNMQGGNETYDQNVDTPRVYSRIDHRSWLGSWDTHNNYLGVITTDGEFYTRRCPSHAWELDEEDKKLFAELCPNGKRPCIIPLARGETIPQHALMARVANPCVSVNHDGEPIA